MKDASAPRSGLSEAAEGTIMSSVWVALILALVGSSFNGNGEFRWSSLLPDAENATAAIAEVRTAPALTVAPEGGAAAPAGTSVPAAKPESLALSSDVCRGGFGPLGLCGYGLEEIVQLGLPVASRDLPQAATSATR